jgi:hypothetical protein
LCLPVLRVTLFLYFWCIVDLIFRIDLFIPGSPWAETRVIESLGPIQGTGHRGYQKSVIGYPGIGILRKSSCAYCEWRAA